MHIDGVSTGGNSVPIPPANGITPPTGLQTAQPIPPAPIGNQTVTPPPVHSEGLVPLSLSLGVDSGEPIPPPLKPQHAAYVDEPNALQSDHFGKTWGRAGLVSRFANMNAQGTNGVDKAALGFDAVAMLSNNEKISAHAGGMGLGLGVLSQMIKGQQEDGVVGAAREGSVGSANVVVSNAIFASKETKNIGVALREGWEPTKALVKTVPATLQKGYAIITNVAARKDAIAGVGQFLLNTKNAVSAGTFFSGASSFFSVSNLSKVGSGAAGFAGKAGLFNGLVKASGDGGDYLSGKKALTKENSAETTVSTVMAIDPIHAVASMIGFHNFSIEKGMSHLTGNKGKTLSEISKETMALNEHSAHAFKPEKNPYYKPNTGKAPSMIDYAHLHSIAYYVAPYIPGGKLDGHDVVREFKEIDMTKPQNYRAYDMAIRRAAQEQDKIMHDNDSWVPRNMRYGESAVRYGEAETQLNLLTAAQEECRHFIMNAHDYNKAHEVLKDQKAKELAITYKKEHDKDHGVKGGEHHDHAPDKVAIVGHQNTHGQSQKLH